MRPPRRRPRGRRSPHRRRWRSPQRDAVALEFSPRRHRGDAEVNDQDGLALPGRQPARSALADARAAGRCVGRGVLEHLSADVTVSNSPEDVCTMTSWVIRSRRSAGAARTRRRRQPARRAARRERVARANRHQVQALVDHRDVIDRIDAQDAHAERADQLGASNSISRPAGPSVGCPSGSHGSPRCGRRCRPRSGR